MTATKADTKAVSKKPKSTIKNTTKFAAKDGKNNATPKKFNRPGTAADQDKRPSKSFGGSQRFNGTKPGAYQNKFKSANGTKPGAFQNKFKSANNNGGSGGGGGTAVAEGEKQDWAKFKKDKKDLKLKRKSEKKGNTYDISKDVKQIYEKLKCRRTEHKDKLVEEIYKLLNVGDTISKVVKAHDTARVLQCMLKFATPALRAELSDKLLPFVVDMCQSKYAQFCVQRMIKYGAPATKSKLVDNLMGNIVRLAGHNIASSILDTLYLNVANAQQKNHMRQEFYGDLYRKSKDNAVKSLPDTYKQATNMKASILGAVKANLEHVANKNQLDSSLVHAVILEYLHACDDDEKVLEEAVTSFAAYVPHMLSTKDGSEAAIICFYKSTPKNRRAIIKNIKEHLLKISTHEHGHIFLIALLNALDDTKAAKKAIYDHLHGDLLKLAGNPYGRRVIQWLVAPGDTSCFHPGFTKLIEEGLSYGKKDKDLRRKEIFEQIEAPIAENVAENAQFWLSNGRQGLVTRDILNHLTGENYEKACAGLVEIIVNPDWLVSATQAPEDSNLNKKKLFDVETVIAEATKQRKKLLQTQTEASSSDDEDDDDDDDDETEDRPKKAKLINKKTEEKQEEEQEKPNIVGIEEAGMHVVLKKIIQNDTKRQDASSFAPQLIKRLTKDTLKLWFGVNRGCFILVNLVEQSKDLVDNCRSIIDEAPELRKLLLGQSTPGAKLLATKLGFTPSKK